MKRYTQTELDKIMMVGFGKIDQAVEAVIEKHCPKPKPAKPIKHKVVEGVKLEHDGIGIVVGVGASHITFNNCTITTKPQSTALYHQMNSEVAKQNYDMFNNPNPQAALGMAATRNWLGI